MGDPLGVRRSKPWKEHPEEPVDVNFQGSVEDELSQVADWIDSILDPFYTRDVKKNKILWAWQAGVGQKIFHYRFDEAFVLGFYVLDFRTRDGANFVTMELDHFHLQEPEKRRETAEPVPTVRTGSYKPSISIYVIDCNSNYSCWS